MWPSNKSNSISDFQSSKITSGEDIKFVMAFAGGPVFLQPEPETVDMKLVTSYWLD